MKSIKFFKLLLILEIIFLSTLININSIKIKKAEPSELDKNWSRLFTDPNRTTIACKEKPEDDLTEEEKKMEQEDNSKLIKIKKVKYLPKKKNNYYGRKKIGWGPSAYFFDFLDDVLNKEIITNFKKIYEEAKLVKTDVKYKEPYSLENMTQMKKGSNNEEMLKKIENLTKNSAGESTFDIKSWQNSITVSQINTIIKEWKWFENKSIPDPAKALVDKYDFNGDGRLSPKEFIIAMIRHNKHIANSGQCKNCMENVIKNTIDPIFMYLDCSNEEKINSESIWKNLQKLNRSKPMSFNFYTCDFNGGSYRTDSVNDFVIKSKRSMDGYVNKSEFRLAILQGYWARHVDDYAIYEDNTLNLKPLRWDEDGMTDKVCESLKNSN